MLTLAGTHVMSGGAEPFAVGGMLVGAAAFG
jgi:hypothetical protein